MAVYTDVAAEDLAPLPRRLRRRRAACPIRALPRASRIRIFWSTPSRGYFILTLYERRVAERDLPFFLGLMEHLASRGITCPQPVKNKAGKTLGKLAGRPAAMVTFLDGMWIRRPSAAHCAALGEALARLHLAGADFAMRRDNALSVAGWRAALRRLPRARRTRWSAISKPSSPPSSTCSNAIGRAACRRGSSTPICFPTTCSSSATGCPG